MIHSRNEASDGFKSVASSEITPELNLPLQMRSNRNLRATKNRSGFTLIEVLLAVAIVGIVLGPIYILQGAVFDRVIRMAESVDRMLVAYDVFVDVKDGDENVIKKTVTDPLTDIVYEKKEPQKSSILAKEFNHLFIKKISWHWKYQDTSYGDVLMDIAFNPPEQKEEPEQPLDKKQQNPEGQKKDNEKGGEKKEQGKKDEKKPTEVKKS